MQADSCTSPEVELELPPEPGSVTKARQAVVELARAVGAAADDVALAVSEAVGNAVVHAFRGRDPGTIAVSAAVEEDMLLVTVADDGTGMMPNLESQGLRIGSSLISRLSDEARFESTEGGTTVTMRFELSG